MEKGLFRFKLFACRHYASSMRIGVDAVLLGAWADVSGQSILDVGTGCGVIALMCAQRNPMAMIRAIDIDDASVSEASENFIDSPWGKRLQAECVDFASLEGKGIYDLIISNPPYFKSGVNPESSVRMQARHEGGLSPYVLLEHGRQLLREEGRIAMVIPWLRADEVIADARELGYFLRRRMDVRGNKNAPFKRTLLEFQTTPAETIGETLILEESPNVPTPEHRDLCGQFYLYY